MQHTTQNATQQYTSHIISELYTHMRAIGMDGILVKAIPIHCSISNSKRIAERAISSGDKQREYEHLAIENCYTIFLCVCLVVYGKTDAQTKQIYSKIIWLLLQVNYPRSIALAIYAL